MTFLEQLQSHKGSLLRLKTELFWYDGRGWDKNPGQVCLLLEATATIAPAHAAAAAVIAAQSSSTARTAAANLLIDGSPRWVWVAEEDVELL